jgi:hypothetical protein
MATNYTTVLKLALPTTGELVGSWGSVVNNQITQMVEQAITGIATISTWSGASHTLTTANGSTSESRCAILQCSGAPGAAAEVICPAQSKIYIVRNGVTGGYTVTLKTSAGTGIAVPNGKVMWLYCDGTNVVEATNHLVSLTLATPLAASSGGTGVANSYNINLGGALSISGALSVLGNDAVTINTSANTNVTLPTSGTLITTDSADTITNKDISGLTNNIHDVSLTSDVIGTLPIANGGLGVTTVPTNGQIPIGNGSGYTVANITSGAGITVIGGAGSLQIAATGALAPGDVIGPASAVDSQIALFSGTSGKIIQAATTTGLLKASSGVIAAAVAGTDYGNVSSSDTVSTDNAIARFDSTSGRLIQVSSAGVTDAGFLTANGLTFPAVQVSSADANTLDDYEEGTWTPIFGSTDIFYGDITLTYYTVPTQGLYRKIGSVVFVSFEIAVSSLTVTGSTSSALYIEGLPYIPISGFPLNSSQITIGFAGGWSTNAPSIGYFNTTSITTGTGSIGLNYKTSPNALTWGGITGANLSSTTTIYASGFYFTAT